MKSLFYERLLKIDGNEMIEYEDEIPHEFLVQISSRLASVGRYLGTVGFPETLYSIVRHLRPDVVVETGVGGGLSSAFLLKGLQDNHRGRLYSIDLLNHEEVLAREGRIEKAVAILPPNLKQGFIVPDELTERWELLYGRTQDLLPSLLKKVGPVQLFFHDSEHTYENMMFEYFTSWPHIESKGFLLSDNINDNKAFFDFAKKVQQRICRLYLTPLGGIQKLETV
jgi:predicted O-methyltransferase YrrM